MTPDRTSEVEPFRIVLVADGKQRTYTSDDDGLMWRYRTPEGWRWIGWRTLAAQFEQRLEERADLLSREDR